MSYLKQQAINHYLENMDNDDFGHKSFNRVDDIVWVNADKIIAVLKEHALLKETVGIKIPPESEAIWNSEETLEFDRVLQEVLFPKTPLH